MVIFKFLRENHRFTIELNLPFIAKLVNQYILYPKF